MSELFLTVREVASLENVSPRSVRARIAKGSLSATGDAGEKHLVPLSELQEKSIQKYVENQKAEVKVPCADKLTGEKAILANEIFSAIVKINICDMRAGRDKMIAQYAKELGMSSSKLYKILKTYRATGSLSCLIRRKRVDSGKMRNWTPEAVRELVTIYGTEKSKIKAFNAVYERAAEHGWKIGSLSSACRFLERVDNNSALSVYIREGERGLINKIIPSNLRDYSTARVNEYFCGDHHIFDLFVYDRSTHRVYRPWITAWQDVRTRAIAGYYICKSPSSRTISQALQHAICRSGRQRHFGLPKYAYIDNGKDYKCHYLTGDSWKEKRYGTINYDPVTEFVMHELGIELIFAIPFNPQSKPIERFFRTVEESLIKSLPGYCGNKPENRNAHQLVEEISKQKLLELDEFKLIFETWLANKYHAKPHTGDGMDGKSPDEVWDEQWSSLNYLPVTVDDSRIIYNLFQERKNAQITRHGVMINKQLYYNEVMMFHVGHPAEVRYDPDDPSEVQVYVFEPKTGELEYLCPAQPFHKAGWGMPKEELSERIADQRRMKNFIIGIYEGLIGPRQVNNSRGPGNFRKAIEKYEKAIEIHDTITAEKAIKGNGLKSKQLSGINMLPPDDYFENDGNPSENVFDLLRDDVN